MAADIRGGEGIVLPHVQRFADDVMTVGATSFGTYPGHDPDISRAVDCFVDINSRVIGDAICAFAIGNMKRYGIWYLIYRQRIYNPEIGNYWRDMARRGSPSVFDYTANHYDHVHLSFYVTGGVIVVPKPKHEEMNMKVRYVWQGVDWLFDSAGRIHATGMTDGVLKACDLSGVKEMGKVDDATHVWFQNSASQW